MRCACCDKTLSEKEINWNSDLEAFEYCGTCLDIIMDTAYSQKFFEDESHVVDSTFDDEVMYGDSSDIWSQSWEEDYD